MSAERASRAASVVAALVVAAGLATAYDRTPERVRDGWTRLHQDAGTRTDRRLEPALAHTVSKQALLGAAAMIPPHARYTIVTGDWHTIDVSAAKAARVYLREWLLPRIFVRRPQDADWVITYHYSSERLPVSGREIGLGPDANLVEVQR